MLSRAIAAKTTATSGGAAAAEAAPAAAGPPTAAGRRRRSSTPAATPAPSANPESSTPTGRDPGVVTGPSTPQDWQAINGAMDHGSDTVPINGRPVSPAAHVGPQRPAGNADRRARCSWRRPRSPRPCPSSDAVSSLIGPRRSYVGARPTRFRRRLQALSIPLPKSGTPLSVAIAVVVLATAFASRGGSELERTTWTEVGIMLLGAGAVRGRADPPARRPHAPAPQGRLRARRLRRDRRVHRAQRDLVADAQRLLDRVHAARSSYFAAFAGALALGRIAPGRWSAVLVGIALGAVALSCWSLLTKVFPAALAPNDTFARLRPPSDYWNSVGLTAALGVPPLLWLAARRSGHAAYNALAWPGLGLAFVCLMLAYSRGALLALALGLIVWFAIVPLRLRAALALGGTIIATIPIVAWAFAQKGLTTDDAAMALRVDAGQGLGALLLLLIVAMTIAGLAVNFLSARAPAERAGAAGARAACSSARCSPSPRWRS